MEPDVNVNPPKVIGKILHVVVIGFHHKKGCQVEYAYPPFHEGDSVDNTECPEEWKHLPSLALPDGAHNFEKDTIFFHMPSRKDPSKAVYGISCYRQINAESLINKSADVTRGTVQKSVCIISTLPLYGLINAKLELITHAYFDERDFSKVALLEETFRSLNNSLNEALTQGQQIFLGLSARSLVVLFKHKIVLLFKLVLLEKKILFLKSPVKDLCTSVLALLSLFPGMLEYGMENCMKLGEVKDPVQSFEVIEPESNLLESLFDVPPGVECDSKSAMDANELKNRRMSQSGDDCPTLAVPIPTAAATGNVPSGSPNTTWYSPVAESRQNVSATGDALTAEEAREASDARLLLEIAELLDSDAQSERVDLVGSKLQFRQNGSDAGPDYEGGDDFDETPAATEVEEADSLKGSKSSLNSRESATSGVEGTNRIANLKGRVMGALGYWSGSKEKSAETSSVVETTTVEDFKDLAVATEMTESVSDVDLNDPNAKLTEVRNSLMNDVLNLDIRKCGLPLNIFDEGMLCHPYLSLPFLDLLKDPGVRGFVAGATNVLFKQKRHLVDVIIELDEGNVDILDNDLKRQLHLTTEDLRFSDYLVKNITDERDDIFLNGTGWEGGDEWLRAQFQLYFLCLLRTSLLQEGSREIESYNPSFMSAWQQTYNYTTWKNSDHWSVLEINPGHPFHGQLSMADMRLRLSHRMQSSERGRKINQAVVNTGKAVAQTSRALGGAISQAKSTVSSWLQVFGTPQQPMSPLPQPQQ